MRKIVDCLNPTLQSICKKAIELESMTEIVQQYLPVRYQEHCKVGSFSKGCLYLHVPNALFAAELRYLLPELRDQLRSEGRLYQLITIKIQIDC